MSDTDDAFVEIPVHAAVLSATADLLDLLRDFFTSTDPATRTQLGYYLIDHHGDATITDSAIEAAVMLQELSDAAELLHALAGDDNTGLD